MPMWLVNHTIVGNCFTSSGGAVGPTADVARTRSAGGASGPGIIDPEVDDSLLAIEPNTKAGRMHSMA